MRLKQNISLILIFLLSLGLNAATFSCTGNGDWSSSATWGGSGIPGAGDDVVIKNGATVTVDVSNAECANIQLGSNSNPSKGNGSISFNASSQLTSSGTVNFGDGGQSGYIEMTSGGTFITNDWNGKKGGLTSGIGTIRYTGTFTLANSSSFNQFYDLEIMGFVTMSTGIQIDNNLTLTSGIFDVGGKSITMLGNWINNGGDFVEGTGTELVTFQGSAIQVISGDSFNRLEVNNPFGIELSGDVTINDLLTFTDGDITLGSNNLILESAASTSDQSNDSHVVTNGAGALRMNWTTYLGKSFTFPLGDGTNYTPFLLTMNNSAPAGGDPYIEVKLKDEAEPNHSTDNYLTRYWDVSESDLTIINYNWSAYYINSDVIGEEDFITAAKYNGSWVEFDNVDATNNILSGDNGTGFSTFTGKTGIISLPVELTYFGGSIVNDMIKLEWITSSEINNDYFIIEESSDGINFSEIGQVNGVGNSIEINNYNYSYLSSGNLAFYRLKQVDFDGTYDYSAIIKIEQAKSSEPIIFPNPVSRGQMMTIYFKATKAQQINLFSTNGVLVAHQKTLLDNKISFSTSLFSPGNYLAQIVSASNVSTLKFTVTP